MKREDYKGMTKKELKENIEMLGNKITDATFRKNKDVLIDLFMERTNLMAAKMLVNTVGEKVIYDGNEHVVTDIAGRHIILDKCIEVDAYDFLCNYKLNKGEVNMNNNVTLVDDGDLEMDSSYIANSTKSNEDAPVIEDKKDNEQSVVEDNKEVVEVVKYALYKMKDGSIKAFKIVIVEDGYTIYDFETGKKVDNPWVVNMDSTCTEEEIRKGLNMPTEDFKTVMAAVIKFKEDKKKESLIPDKITEYIPGMFVKELLNGHYYELLQIEANGMFRLRRSTNGICWVVPSNMIPDRYLIVSKEEAAAGMVKELDKSKAEKKETYKPVYNKSIVTKEGKEIILNTRKPRTKEELIAKAKAAGEYAKTHFDYRIEQRNNFRQVVLVNNKTGEIQQVGAGATVAGKIMEYEFISSHGVKVTTQHIAENKQKYNANVKRTTFQCVECAKQGKEHYISVAEYKYLVDNQKYLPDNLKNVALCFNHQMSTGLKRIVIAGLRNESKTNFDATKYNTSLTNDKDETSNKPPKTLLR